MASLTNRKDFGDLSICIALDNSGSTYGRTLGEEITAVEQVCRLLSPTNEDQILLLPWSDKASKPIRLPKEFNSMQTLTSGGGTNPSVLYSSPLSLEALNSCGLWFLLTDGQIDDRLVQEFALSTAELGLHGLACVVVVFGSTFSGPPAQCDISVGIAAYAVAPDCLFLFHDIPTGKLSILQAKGCFKELLPKSNNAHIQPRLSKYTTWAELPHIAYEDLSRVRVPPARKVTSDELALQDDLVIRMQDLYSGAASEEQIGDLIKNEDNLKSLVMAEMTRGTGKELQTWLKEQQKPVPKLTHERPDIGGRAQDTVAQLLDGIKNGEGPETIERLRSSLREAHDENWSRFREGLANHSRMRRSTLESNEVYRRASHHCDIMEKELDEAPQRRVSSFTCGPATGGEVEYRDRTPEEVGNPELESLFLPGFTRTPDIRDSEFQGRCMLCHGHSVLSMLLKSPPDITTTNFPRRGSYSPLAFPLAMSSFAETDILSFYLCCDSCAVYLVRNSVSPDSETVTGALPLVSSEHNHAAWLALDVSFKGRFGLSDLATLFIGILDRMLMLNIVRDVGPEDKSLYNSALQWAKQDLSRVAEVPVTLSRSFSPRGPNTKLRTRSLQTVLSDRALRDPANSENADISMLRYPVQGFMVIIRLIRDQGATREQLQTHVFQRLMYHLTEVHIAELKHRRGINITSPLQEMLRTMSLHATLTQQQIQSNFATTISVNDLLEHSILDLQTLECFRTMDEFQALEEQIGPATAVYLHALARHGTVAVTPVECFNTIKIIPTMRNVLRKPLAISKGLSADLILQMEDSV